MTANPKLLLEIEGDIWAKHINAPGIGNKIPWVKFHYEDIIAPLKKYGVDLLPMLGEPQIEPTSPPTIGFVIHSAVITPETQWFIDFLRANPNLKAMVFVLTANAPEIKAALGDFPIICIQAPTPLKKLFDLRLYAEIHNLSAMVFVGMGLWVTTAAAMKVAPVTTWLHDGSASRLGLADYEITTASDVPEYLRLML